MSFRMASGVGRSDGGDVSLSASELQLDGLTNLWLLNNFCDIFTIVNQMNEFH